jgi:hypothetical protein
VVLAVGRFSPQGVSEKTRGCCSPPLSTIGANCLDPRPQCQDRFARLLEIGYALGLTDTPASSQAAEMLERIALFSSYHRGAKSNGG